MVTAEKEKIVTEFFKRGHLLTDEAIKELVEQEAGYEQFLSRNLPLVIDTKDLQQPYKILKNVTQAKEQVTTEDFTRFYKSKYEKMRNIIISRMQKDFTSLNKIDASRGEVHVLGMIKEIREKDGKKIIELEDTTGTVPVIFDIEVDAELDDVIAIRAVAGGRVLYGKKIIYPDIPLRQPTKGTGKACFASDLRLDEVPTADAERFFEWFSQQDIPYLFVAGELGDNELFEKYVDRYCYMKIVFVAAGGEPPVLPVSFASSRIVPLSNPSVIEIGGLKILMTIDGNVQMLKKRHLGKSRMVFDEDHMVLEDTPDIMHSSGDGPYVTNYKSVTLVNSGPLLGDFRPVVVDFATRDVEKITLR